MNDDCAHAFCVDAGVSVCSRCGLVDNNVQLVHGLISSYLFVVVYVYTKRFIERGAKHIDDSAPRFAVDAQRVERFQEGFFY